MCSERLVFTMRKRRSERAMAKRREKKKKKDFVSITFSESRRHLVFDKDCKYRSLILLSTAKIVNLKYNDDTFNFFLFITFFFFRFIFGSWKGMSVRWKGLLRSGFSFGKTIFNLFSLGVIGWQNKKTQVIYMWARVFVWPKIPFSFCL